MNLSAESPQKSVTQIGLVVDASQTLATKPIANLGAYLSCLNRSMIPEEDPNTLETLIPCDEDHHTYILGLSSHLHLGSILHHNLPISPHYCLFYLPESSSC